MWAPAGEGTVETCRREANNLVLHMVGFLLSILLCLSQLYALDRSDERG